MNGQGDSWVHRVWAAEEVLHLQDCRLKKLKLMIVCICNLPLAISHQRNQPTKPGYYVPLGLKLDEEAH